MMLTNHPRCIFKSDCFIVRLTYTFVCTFQAEPEPTQSPQVSLVHTFAVIPGVMWEPASHRSSHRSGWFRRFRPSTEGSSPPSLNFESRGIKRRASLTPRLPSRDDVALDSSAKPLARLSRSAWRCVH